MKDIKENDMWIWLKVEEKERAEDASTVCAQMNEPGVLSRQWLSIAGSSTAEVFRWLDIFTPKLLLETKHLVFIMQMNKWV